MPTLIVFLSCRKIEYTACTAINKAGKALGKFTDIPLLNPPVTLIPEERMKKVLFILICAMAVMSMECKTADKAQAKTGASSGDKLCALTFDDGPDSGKTPLVLDKLEKYGVPATFFVIGQLVNDSTKPVLDRMVAMDCEVANHSWEWSGMNAMSNDEISESISKTSKAIRQYTGKAPSFFRPPNLSVSDEMFATVGLPFADGVLGMDWAGCDTGAGERAQNVIAGMRDGAIILLHDVQPDPHPTPEALDILIPELKKQGYEFVTLSELFRRKGVKPDPRAQVMWKYVE
jgi:peptidoglycan/xylan/chitin deacetylase (PgdA/CDA1 family)